MMEGEREGERGVITYKTKLTQVTLCCGLAHHIKCLKSKPELNWVYHTDISG